MSRGPVHVGDVLRAAGALGIRDTEGVRTLIRVMGLPGSGPRPAGTAPAARPPRPRPEPEAVRDAPARRHDGRPAPARPAAAPGGGTGGGTAPGADRPASVGGSLLSFPAPAPAGGPEPPAGDPPPLEEVLLGSPGDAPEHLPAPPWNPRTERAILLAVAATEAAGREVDRRRLIDLTVHRLGGRPLTGDRHVPYRLRPSTRAGLHLLLDRGPSMRPFGHDHQWIAHLARRVLPPDQLRVFDFRLAQGVSSDGGRTWHAGTRLTPGTPVVLVSDLGHLRPPVAVRNQASPADWLAFVTQLRRAGHPVTCLTPFPPEAYPAELRRAVALVPLDRRTSVGSARDRIRRLRRPGRTV